MTGETPAATEIGELRDGALLIVRHQLATTVPKAWPAKQGEDVMLPAMRLPTLLQQWCNIELKQSSCNDRTDHHAAAFCLLDT